MRNFNAEKIEIAIRYWAELNNPQINIDNNTRVCMNCDMLMETDLANTNNPECIRLKVLKNKSSDVCCICGSREGPLNRISLQARVQIYLDTNIYVPVSVRLCPNHLDNEGYVFRILCQDFKAIFRPITLQGIEIQNLFVELRNRALLPIGDRLIKENALSADDFYTMTSLTKL